MPASPSVPANLTNLPASPPMKLTKYYASFVIVFAILLSTTIIPSLLPHPKYLLYFSLLGYFLIVQFRGGKLYILQSQQFRCVASLWLLFYASEYLTFCLHGPDSISDIFGFFGISAVLLPLLIVLSTYEKLYGFQSLLRLYVGLCFVISVPGIIAWALITFDLVTPHAWFVNIGHLTDGKFPIRGAHFHSAPYYLSLVQYYESALFTLFNIPYQLYRLAGFSSESQYAALLVAPSLFLIYPAIKKLVVRRIIFITVLTFLICTFSATLFSIMFLLSFLYLLRQRNIGLIFLWICASIILIFFYASHTVTSGDTTQDLLVSKYIGEMTSASNTYRFMAGIFNTDTLFYPGFGQYTLRQYAGFFPYVSFYAVIFTVAFIALKLIFSNNEYWQIGFSALYLIIHCLKGMGPFILTWPFFGFIIWLLCFSFKFPNRKRSLVSLSRVVETPRIQATKCL